MLRLWQAWLPAHRNTLHFHQEAYDPADGFEISDREDHNRSLADNATGGVSAAYKLSDAATLTLKGEYGKYDALTTGISVYRGFDNFDELSRVKTGNRHSDFQALYEYVGASNGLLAYDVDNGDRFQLSATGFSKTLTWQGIQTGFTGWMPATGTT